MAVVEDLTAELPRADWSIGRSTKDSITVHWNGTPVPDDVADIDVIFGDAAYQMSPTWPGRTGGADGIQYHRLYGRDGTVYLTRDPGDYLWHCGDPDGNRNSEAWQVMCGVGEVMTDAQRTALSRDLLADGRPRRGHREWPLAASSCPGDEIVAFIHSDMEVEDDMTDEQFKQYLAKIDAQTDAFAIYIARQQRGVDVVTGKAYDPKKNGVDPAPEVIANRGG